MTRSRNTTSTGGGFDATTIQAVWNKGQIVSGYNPAQYRKDACGAWMHSVEYGTTTDMGWEIDHIHPVAKGGSDMGLFCRKLEFAL